MTDYNVDKIKYSGNTYKLLDNGALHTSDGLLSGTTSGFKSNGTIAAEQGIFNKLIATSASIGDLDVNNLTATNATVVGLLDVQGEMHTNSWTNANIANIGGSFYISPTLASAATSVTISLSSNKYTITVSGGTFATSSSGITWSTGSKVMVTGSVTKNNITYPLGTCTGNLSAISSTGFTVNNISVTNTDSSIPGDSTVNGSLAKIISDFGSGTIFTSDEIKISMYEIGPSGSYKPVGIMMTSYGINKSTYLDIYGGVNQKNSSTGAVDPNLRIGYLGDLASYTDSSGTTRTPTGWGIYTDNGFFKGTIVADSGSISKFKINTTTNGSAISTGTIGATDGILISPDNTASYTINGGSRSNLRLAIGTKFGVDNNGTLYADGANITNINANNISTNLLSAIQAKVGTLSAITADMGTLTAGTISYGPTGNNNTIYLSANSSKSATIAGALRENLRFTIGRNFGVDSDGKIYATSADITGAITASSLTINANTAITDSSGKISNDAIEIGGTNLLRQNNPNINSENYLAAQLYLTEPLEAEQIYTLQLWNVYVRHSAKTNTTIGVDIYYCGESIKFGGWHGGTYFTSVTIDNVQYYHADKLTLTFTPHTDNAADTSGGNQSSSGGISTATWTEGESPFINICNSDPSVSGTLELTIGNYKIEKGNKPTDWVSTFDDVNASIEDTNSKIDTEISNVGIDITGLRDDLNIEIGERKNGSLVERQLVTINENVGINIKGISGKATSLNITNNTMQFVTSSTTPILTIHAEEEETSYIDADMGRFEFLNMKSDNDECNLTWVARSNGHLTLKEI